jgi:hypothetical protein
VKTLAAPKLEQPELDLNPILYSPTDWATLDALFSSAHFRASAVSLSLLNVVTSFCVGCCLSVVDFLILRCSDTLQR